VVGGFKLQAWWYFAIPSGAVCELGNEEWEFLVIEDFQVVEGSKKLQLFKPISNPSG